MKKKLLAMFLCLGLMMAAIGGCGNTAPGSAASGAAGSGAAGSGAAASEEDQSAKQTEEPEDLPVEEPAKDWVEEHGLVITPQGDFSFTTMTYDTNDKAVSLIEVKGTAAITETTDGVEDGYKNVSVVFTTDVSGINEVGAYGEWHWLSAFDRYTGTSFEFDAEQTQTEAGETTGVDGFATVVNGEESYNVAISLETVNNYPIITNTLTVTCPVDYDGVVFQIGYNDAELMESDTIDYAARLYTIDELPYYGDGYYYFSLTNA